MFTFWENFPERQFRKLVHHHLLASIPDFNRLEPILAATCCADLEERVAELEATTVRKDNRQVSVQLYGKINRMVESWDGGGEKNTKEAEGCEDIHGRDGWWCFRPCSPATYPRSRQAPILVYPTGHHPLQGQIKTGDGSLPNAD